MQVVGRFGQIQMQGQITQHEDAKTDLRDIRKCVKSGEMDHC